MCLCVCVSYPRDIHDLDGCQLPRLNMATLVEGGEETDRHRDEEMKFSPAMQHKYITLTLLNIKLLISMKRLYLSVLQYTDFIFALIKSIICSKTLSI